MRNLVFTILFMHLGLLKAQVFNNIYNNYNHVFYRQISDEYAYNYDFFNGVYFNNYGEVVCYGSSDLAETHWGTVDTTFMYINELYLNGDTIRTKEFLIDNNELSILGNPYFYEDGSSISFGYSREKYLPYQDSTQYGLIVKLDSNLNVSNYNFLEFGQSTVIVNSITIDSGLNFYTISNVDIDTSNNRQYHIFFSKIDSAGNVLFNYEIGGMDWDLAYDIEHLKNGNFLISGYTWSQGTNNSSDFYLFEIDTLGNIVWEQTYGYPGSDISGANSLLLNNKGEIYICGKTELNTGNNTAWLIKTDSVGNMLWEKKYDRGEYYDGFNGIQIAKDGNLILSGSTQNYDHPNIPATGWLLKVDTLGNIIWERLISKYNNQNNSSEYINDMKISDDGFIYLSGYVSSGGVFTNGIYHGNDGWLCKTDSCGFTTGAQPQALLIVDSVVGATVYITNLSEEYCISSLDFSIYDSSTGDTLILDSLDIYAYSEFTNGEDPTQIQYTYTDTGTYNLTLYTYAGDGIDTFTTQVEITDIGTSINNVNRQLAVLDMNVFPNPAKDYFILEADFGNRQLAVDDFGIIEGGLYTTTGQKVQEFNINPKLLQQRIYLNDLANGVYLLKVTYGNMFLGNERISVVR